VVQTYRICLTIALNLAVNEQF